MIESDLDENITVVMLKVKNETYLVDVADVKEIFIPGDKIVPVPLAEKSIIGVIDIRNKIYSIISLRHLIYRDGGNFAPNDKSRLILAEMNGLQIGLLVDSVLGVRQLPVSIFELKNIIVETRIDYKFIDSIGVLNNETFILLDLNAIVQSFVLSMQPIAEQIIIPKLKTQAISESRPALSDKSKIKKSLKASLKSRLQKQKISIDDGVLLTQYQQDILKELGNIGSGNAVTALSRLIKKKIDVNLTDVGIISFDKMAKQFGNSSQQVCGIFSNIDKPSKSTILQIFDMKPLLSLIASMTGKKSKIDPNKVKTKKDLDKFAISTITEMGNIMAGHYASALGDLTGIKLMIDVPEFTMSTVGELGKFLSNEFKTISEYVLIIKTMINIVDSKLSGIFIFIPDVETLETFFKKLGLSQGPLIKGKIPTQKIPKFDLSKIKLSTTQKDALMEVGNIGAGNAANALAKMINKRVDINIPSVEMVELDIFAKKLSKKKEKMLVAWSNVTGTARATVLTMFSVKDILKISSIIIEDTQKKNLDAEKINTITDLPEFYRSAISELGHILASHYTTALGDLLMIRMMTEAPDMSIDKDQQLFNILKDEIGLLKELSLVITTNVLIKDIKIVGTFLFIPNINTLHELLDALSKFFE